MKYRVCKGKSIRTLRRGMAHEGTVLNDYDIGCGLAGALVAKGAIEPVDPEPVKQDTAEPVSWKRRKRK